MNKNILFVVPYVPNMIRVRPFNLIRHLAGLGHQVTLLTIWSDEQERASLEQIKPYVSRLVAAHVPRWRSIWNCARALPTGKPLQMVFSWDPALARQMDLLLAPGIGRPAYDVVHIEHLRGAQFGVYLKTLNQRQGSSLPVLWDSVDSISYLFRQASVSSKRVLSRGMARFELGRTEQYEGWLLTQFDHVTVTSRSDRDAFLSLVKNGKPRTPISILPNGVDLAYFKPGPFAQRDPARLVISGKMSYHANVTMVLDFVHLILPRIWEKRPDVQLTIVGKDPTREILALDANPNISVTGTVEHLPPYLQQASAAVTPIAYGAGIQNKVLEAMACATPVVTTPQAVAALDVQAGEEVLVAPEPEAFAQAVVALLNSPELQRRIGEAGRCYVEAHHSWSEMASQLDDLYSQLRDGKRGGGW